VNLEGWLKEAGFEDVVEEKSVVPSSPWAKDKEMKAIGGVSVNEYAGCGE